VVLADQEPNRAYGDFMPAPHARLVALTEGFLGAFLIGFFVVVLAHGLARL
jgi:hypothetical protein